MNKMTGVSVAALAVTVITASLVSFNTYDATAVSDSEALKREPRLLAQTAQPGAVPSSTSSAATPDSADEAPEMTEVSGQLLQADGSPVSGGVLYFVFQGRLNELPHADPLAKVIAMHEVAQKVDSEGSFTLKMKPGNFAMVYDPAATEVPAEAGPESMNAMKRLTPEQVQARIAAIKENAAKGLPVSNGKIGEAFVVENRAIRPPVTDFGQIQLQNEAMITVKAVDGNGELINFPATLRLRGKNGDIMEPHTPSVSTRAQYNFHDLMPQSYQVFALGSLPPPGAGDTVTTPTIENDQLIFTGETLSHEVVVKPGTPGGE